MEHDEYKLIGELMDYYAGQPKRIQHALKVYSFADMIATGEKLDADMRKTIVLAAIVHDAGIKIAEEKYGRSAVPMDLFRRKKVLKWLPECLRQSGQTEKGLKGLHSLSATITHTAGWMASTGGYSSKLISW